MWSTLPCFLTFCCFAIPTFLMFFITCNILRCLPQVIYHHLNTVHHTKPKSWCFQSLLFLQQLFQVSRSQYNWYIFFDPAITSWAPDCVNLVNLFRKVASTVECSSQNRTLDVSRILGQPGSIDRMCRSKPASSPWRLPGGYFDPSAFLVSPT